MSTDDTFSSAYEKGKAIGSGAYSIVYEGTSKKTGQKVAIKALLRSNLTARYLENLKHEITVLRSLDHPNVLKMLDFCMDKEHFYIVTEYLDGGELFASIVSRVKYSESDAQSVLKALGTALQYCHERSVVHRDLKPENILLSSKKPEEATIKICDFGFARSFSDQDHLHTALGTPQYLAPEILRGEPYDASVDVWAFGVIAYILLCGYPPFYDENQKILFEKIKSGAYSFDDIYWSNISDSAKALIKSILVTDPKARPSIEQIMREPWMVAKLHEKDITPAMENMRSRLLGKDKMKAGVRMFMAIERMKKLTVEGEPA